jgi:hypothetical protein
MASSDDDNVLRRIEDDVLDRHHLDKRLLTRNCGIATHALLQRYGQILRGLRTGAIPKINNDAKSQTAQEGLRGLAHCLRWVHKHCPAKLYVPSADSNVIADEALELLQWAVKYDPIWNQHSAYSRGLFMADVNEAEKIITFIPHRQVHPRFLCTQTEAKKLDDERLARFYPESQLAALSKSWHESGRVHGGKMTFDDDTIRSSGAIDVATNWLTQTCLPELTQSDQLLGCTVGDLRRVLAAIHVYSLFVTKLEDVMDDNSMVAVEIQTSVVTREHNDMCNWLSHLASCPADRVNAILSALTFDPSHPHVTLAQQPFVSSRKGELMFLPRMLLSLDLSRMYVGAINSTPKGRRIYAEAIVAIERAGVAFISEDIKSALPKAFHIVTSKTISVENETKITPDILLYCEADKVALIIDVKYASPPFGPADVNNDIKEMNKWQQRMSEYVELVRKTPGVLNQHFPCAPTGPEAVLGLILTRWPLPIPCDFEDNVAGIDWPSLINHLRKERPLTIKELWNWVETRNDITIPGVLAWRRKEVRVADWKYRYAVISPIPASCVQTVTQLIAYSLWEKRGCPLWDDAQDWFKAKELVASNPFAVVESGIDFWL